jgi:transmembrane sensor
MSCETVVKNPNKFEVHKLLRGKLLEEILPKEEGEYSEDSSSQLPEEEKDASEEDTAAPDAFIPKRRVVRLKWSLLIPAAAACSFAFLLKPGLTVHVPVSIKSANSSVSNTGSLFIPAGRAVILMRSDGSTIDLDSVAAGSIVATEADWIIRKVGTSSLVYQHIQTDMRVSMATWNSLGVGRGHGPWHLKLSDGSQVWLAGGSCLSYALGGSSLERRAVFTGKALFDITRDAFAAFSIRTQQGTVIQVLGTSFQVEAETAQSTVRVALLNGKLRVSRGTNSVFLVPAQEIVLRPNGMHVFPIADSAMVVRRMANSLFFYFQNVPMRNVINQVAGWYGCRVISPENVIGVPLSGKLAAVDVESVLRVIETAEIGYAYFHRRGDSILISSGPLKN